MKSKFQVFVQGMAINTSIFQFSGGEYQVNLDKLVIAGNNPVKAHIQAFILDGDIMPLALIVDALRGVYGDCSISLDLPYLPYARQDRVMNSGEALSCKVFCDMINGLGFSNVYINDCHSDVGLALIKNVTNIPLQLPTEYAYILNPLHKPYDAIVAPDAGALKKSYKVAQSYHIPELIRADKTRDVTNGVITGTVVYGDVEGKRLIVCDDICDGGMTFIKLGEELRKQGAKSIDLHVTHGIFSKGKTELLKLYNNVTATFDYEEMFK
ncbi:putative ribose-phosphate pyrophosphokinase [Aeromonas phage LAh_9]|uniref:Phosphoribosylpyrophosphate synthetase n=3 Tax=Lahexavirus TaxID=2843411 RepID=A0A5B9NE95_9CAUD|nr:ribose-phosphate pyrophosphokinase [Aeromonas phage 4_4572]YP_009847278.1 ribose-phosphate pyrophosphokinase [Aeromonas phage LAh_6]YP_009847546.1 ribose-phosphate pyrophosphokinase [Aeromonas phage LAh_9]QDH46510.1 putative ribose-phosphate pyrophosphokinase [Aeromonas phage LAh_6]QDH46891.1 putative ribose-phosphate pyrophosphokinase [Aeromonas phage LAh_9]QEG09143.1 phosphoribosylpyrophosphate synthetase [Aeromonas phage 4_4572]